VWPGAYQELRSSHTAAAQWHQEEVPWSCPLVVEPGSGSEERSQLWKEASVRGKSHWSLGKKGSASARCRACGQHQLLTTCPALFQQLLWPGTRHAGSEISTQTKEEVERGSGSGGAGVSIEAAMILLMISDLCAGVWGLVYLRRRTIIRQG
jgi:hypothetical protein